MGINQKLITEIEKAEHCLMIHADGFITKEILNACIDKVLKGIAVELFLDLENKLFLEGNPFLLNKCIQFVISGGSIIVTPNTVENKFWNCLVDFDKYIFYSLEKDEVVYEYADNGFIDNDLVCLFEQKKEEGIFFLEEKEDIKIKLYSSEKSILIGDAIELNWEVKGADKVIIQGLGEVDTFGRKKIKLEKSSIIKIGATNGQQSKLKAIFVNVLDTDLQFTYDLGFISPIDKQFHTLVNLKNYPHVYGVSQRHEVKLIWNAPLADKINISPFNIIKNRGEITFSPDTSMHIELQIHFKDKIVCRKIQLLVFPIPLFQDKLIPYKDIFAKKYDLKVPVLLVDTVKNIQIAENQRYLHLREAINDKKLRTTENKSSFQVLTSFVFNVLKGKYFHRKGILDEINTIQSYYEPLKSAGRKN